MLADIFIDHQALARFRGSPAADYLDDFTDWLSARHYKKSTIRSYVLAAVRFAEYTQAEQQRNLFWDESQLYGYRRHLISTATIGSRNGERGNMYCGARRLVVFLRELHAASKPLPETPSLVEMFCDWLRRHRGVCDATLIPYRRMATKLIETLGPETTAYSAGKLRSFVLLQVKGYSHSYSVSIVTCVRMFVRFLIATQQCAEGLEHSVPRVSGRPPSTLPKHLPSADVERVIAACNPSTELGARDHAIILLMARLALRADDVAGLKWGDVNWTEGTIWLQGKNRRGDLVPLPQDVGDAILHYIEHMRPAASSDRIFIITTAPYTPIRPRQVSQTAQRALLRAGVQTPSYGAHIFRHSVATTMLRGGVSLDEIGSLLRHADEDTTTAYARVDVDLLRQVALPWPKEVSQC